MCSTYLILAVNIYEGSRCKVTHTGSEFEHPPGVSTYLTYLQSYTYTCAAGYTTTDQTVTTCLQDGKLSLTVPPKCKQISKFI